MADVIKRKREEKLLVDVLFELELEDGTIEKYPIQLSSWDFAELQKKLVGFDENNTESLAKYIEISRNEVFKLPKDVNVSDKEIFYGMEQLMEYIKDITPSINKR